MTTQKYLNEYFPFPKLAIKLREKKKFSAKINHKSKLYEIDLILENSEKIDFEEYLSLEEYRKVMEDIKPIDKKETKQIKLCEVI